MSFSEAVPHRLRLSRATRHRDDTSPSGVFLRSNDREMYFSASMWSDLCRMASDFNATGAPVMANYEEHLPVRTPLHANVPLKPSLEDIA